MEIEMVLEIEIYGGIAKGGRAISLGGSITHLESFQVGGEQNGAIC